MCLFFISCRSNHEPRWKIHIRIWRCRTFTLFSFSTRALSLWRREWSEFYSYPLFRRFSDFIIIIFSSPSSLLGMVQVIVEVSYLIESAVDAFRRVFLSSSSAALIQAGGFDVNSFADSISRIRLAVWLIFKLFRFCPLCTWRCCPPLDVSLHLALSFFFFFFFSNIHFLYTYLSLKGLFSCSSCTMAWTIDWISRISKRYQKEYAFLFKRSTISFGHLSYFIYSIFFEYVLFFCLFY